MYAVVRTDKLFGTDNRAGLVSVRYQPGDVMTAIENGNVVKLGALETGSREIYKGVEPAKNDAIRDIVLVASPEVMYSERKRNLSDFQNEAGAIARGYRLHSGDIFSVTADALSAAGDITVGNVVELDDDTKLKVVSTLTSGSTLVGSVIDINVVGMYTYYVIEIA